MSRSPHICGNKIQLHRDASWRTQTSHIASYLQADLQNVKLESIEFWSYAEILFHFLGKTSPIHLFFSSLILFQISLPFCVWQTESLIFILFILLVFIWLIKFSTERRGSFGAESELDTNIYIQGRWWDMWRNPDGCDVMTWESSQYTQDTV